MAQTADELRSKAAKHRERGNKRMADLYESQADAEDRLAAHLAREIRTTMRIGRKNYRVVMNVNDTGEWYGNAHGSRDVFPAAFVTGHASIDECKAALRMALRP